MALNQQSSSSSPAPDTGGADEWEVIDQLARLLCEAMDARSASLLLAGPGGAAWRASRGGEQPGDAERAGCALVIQCGERVAVHDTRRDPRTRDVAALSQGPVRAFLGAPLVTPAGVVIGSVCVHMSRPRLWNAGHLRQLADWARLLVREVERRTRSSRPPDPPPPQRCLLLFPATSPENAASRSGPPIAANHAWEVCLGYPPAEVLRMSANQLVHPDDHDMYTRLCDRAHRTGQECSRPGLRFVRRDGSVLRGDLRLHSVLDADDRLLFLVEMVPAWHDDAPAEPGSAGSDPEMIAVGPSPDLLWICSFCCKLRNAAGGWTRIESYIEARYGVGFSHGVCDTCRNEHYGPFMK